MTLLEKNETKVGNLSEISAKWLAEVRHDLKESSFIKYEDILKKYILPVYGKAALSDITNRDLIHFVYDLRLAGGVRGQGLSTSTISEILTTLNLLRLYGLRENAEVKFDTHCISLKHARKAIRVFSISEENRLISYLKKKEDLTSIGILTCLYTGIRIGELCALKWNDINLDERVMKISNTMQRLRVVGQEHKTEVRILKPKSIHSARTIPLPETLVNVLSPHYVEDAFLLSGEKQHFVEPRLMQKRFKKILEECEIKDANFHATRHTFATRCVELGFDIKTLSEILGHSSVTITMNKYVHPTMKFKRENMNKLKEVF